VGVVEACGWKFGRWLDIVLMQKTLGSGDIHATRVSSAPMNSRTKNKTVAAWLACLAGALGVHRLYLHGLGDCGLAAPIPTALGCGAWTGCLTYGQDDKLSWLLMPLLGFSLAVACLTGIVLRPANRPEKWNARFNPGLPADSRSGPPTG
jgi:hypothetical protein